jgi:tetratricopeptide (TPR) repeat protein
MNNSGKDPSGAAALDKKTRNYFIISGAAFFLMSFLWALDDAIVRIAFGVGVYYLFLGFYYRYQKKRSEKPFEKYHRASQHRTSQQYSQAQTGAVDWIREIKKPKVIAVIATCIFVLFFIILIGVVLSEVDDVSTDYNFQTAEQYRNNGQYDSAITFYRYVLNEEPESRDALLGYGHSFFAIENYDSALYYYDKAKEVFPEDEEAHYNSALAHYYKQNYDASLREAQQTLTLNPNYANALLLSGDSYYAQNEYDSAIYWYEQGYGLGERSALLCHIMAYIYDTKNQIDRAIPLYQESLNYDSGNVEICTRLGELVQGSEGEVYRNLAVKYKQQ